MGIAFARFSTLSGEVGSRRSCVPRYVVQSNKVASSWAQTGKREVINKYAIFPPVNALDELGWKCVFVRATGQDNLESSVCALCCAPTTVSLLYATPTRRAQRHVRKRFFNVSGLFTNTAEVSGLFRFRFLLVLDVRFAAYVYTGIPTHVHMCRSCV